MGHKGDPEATQDSFTESMWYRTGNIGILDSKRYLHIDDRVKDLVKYNGFQASPSELEDVINRHPLVNEASVAGRGSEERSTELPCAFVVTEENVRHSSKLARDIIMFVGKQVAKL
ncbi:hypothetical protein F5884DRAFT_813651 [Xylogone sp. PMI_703]|nr:hypothetical protein F5884DRAFT_813651 [Xylogone sp. PMI_703]